MAMDPVTLAVLKGRLEQIADEMDATLFRSAFNPIIAEAHDASHGFYDARDRRHVGAGQDGPADLRRRHGLRGQGRDRQGGRGGRRSDATATCGSSTIPMMAARTCRTSAWSSRCSATARCSAYLASVGHWHDVGGNVPGNYNPAATESFQEGMLIPPVKLYDKGVCARTSSTSSRPTPACPARSTATSTARSMRWISARAAHERAARRIWRCDGAADVSAS